MASFWLPGLLCVLAVFVGLVCDLWLKSRTTTIHQPNRVSPLPIQQLEPFVSSPETIDLLVLQSELQKAGRLGCPRIFRNLSRASNALELFPWFGWTWDSLAKSFGSSQVFDVKTQPHTRPIFRYFNARTQMRGAPQRAEFDIIPTMSFPEFVKQVQTSNESSFGVSQSSVNTNTPLLYASLEKSLLPQALHNQLQETDKLLIPDSVLENGNVMEVSNGLAHVWLSSRSVTAHPHYDTSHNVFIQIHGHKLFMLTPPNVLPLFPSLHLFCRQAHIHPPAHPRSYNQFQLFPYPAHIRDDLVVVDCEHYSSVGEKQQQQQQQHHHHQQQHHQQQHVGVSPAEENEEQVETVETEGSNSMKPFVSVLLHPCDVLYLPPYWMHAVRSLTPAFR